RTVAARDGVVPVDEVASRIDHRTRLVTTAAVNFVPGLRTDIAGLGRICQARNVLLVVDAAQSVGVMATDVRAMGIDALSCSTQKGMLALYGMGFLYVRRALAERMRPAYLSRFGINLGGASEADFEDHYTLASGARRFDVGNFNFPASVAAGASLAYLSRHTPPVIEDYVLGLAGDLRRGLGALGLHVCGGLSGPHLAHIVTVGQVVAGGHDLADDRRLQGLYEHLLARGVRLSIRRGALRFSFHLYNRAEDVARVLDLAATFLRKA
ncbi:MAG: cysteine desulfurase, partial [Lacunisphaera sp.]|nr:cysteine desulfurase [Lacunisphaera sp.]